MLLPLPRDKRLAPLLASLEQLPPELQALTTRIGASSRTIGRIFLRETGMGYQQWRQQWRLMRAIELLARFCQRQRLYRFLPTDDRHHPRCLPTGIQVIATQHVVQAPTVAQPTEEPIHTVRVSNEIRVSSVWLGTPACAWAPEKASRLPGSITTGTATSPADGESPGRHPPSCGRRGASAAAHGSGRSRHCCWPMLAPRAGDKGRRSARR